MLPILQRTQGHNLNQYSHLYPHQGAPPPSPPPLPQLYCECNSLESYFFLCENFSPSSFNQQQLCSLIQPRTTIVEFVIWLITGMSIASLSLSHPEQDHRPLPILPHLSRYLPTSGRCKSIVYIDFQMREKRVITSCNGDRQSSSSTPPRPLVSYTETVVPYTTGGQLRPSAMGEARSIIALIPSATTRLKDSARGTSCLVHNRQQYTSLDIKAPLYADHGGEQQIGTALKL